MTRHGGCPAQVTYRQRRPKRKRFTLCTRLLLVGSSTPPALTLMQAAAIAGGEEWQSAVHSDVTSPSVWNQLIDTGLKCSEGGIYKY
jgi:hypothetical protein